MEFRKVAVSGHAAIVLRSVLITLVLLESVQVAPVQLLQVNPQTEGDAPFLDPLLAQSLLHTVASRGRDFLGFSQVQLRRLGANLELAFVLLSFGV